MIWDTIKTGFYLWIDNLDYFISALCIAYGLGIAVRMMLGLPVVSI